MPHYRSADWTRLGHGAYRPTVDDTFAAVLRGWAQRLPTQATFTGLTACRAWGLWLPALPEGLDVEVNLPRDGPRVRTAGIHAVRLAHQPKPWRWEGVRVAAVEEAILAGAATLSDLDVTVLVDSAQRLGFTTAQQLTDYSGLRRRGAPRLRRALVAADGRSESPYESLLRRFHDTIEVAVVPQVDIRSGDGAFIGRADLLIEGTRTLQEYDGADHRAPEQYRKDRRRDAALARAGWVRHGWVRDDLIPSGRAILVAADHAVGRPHDPSRLERWRRMLADSGYGSRKWSQIAA